MPVFRIVTQKAYALQVIRWPLIILVTLQIILIFHRMDSQIAFFCGDSIECRTMGSDKALEIAKQNIEKHYITIGVLEEMEMSMVVLG